MVPCSHQGRARHTGSTHTDIQTLTYAHKINVNKSLIEKKEKLSEPISEAGFASGQFGLSPQADGEA